MAEVIVWIAVLIIIVFPFTKIAKSWEKRIKKRSWRGIV